MLLNREKLLTFIKNNITLLEKINRIDILKFAWEQNNLENIDGFACRVP